MALQEPSFSLILSNQFVLSFGVSVYTSDMKAILAVHNAISEIDSILPLEGF